MASYYSVSTRDALFLIGPWLCLPAASSACVSFQQRFRATHWFRIAPLSHTKGRARVGPIRQGAKPAFQGAPVRCLLFVDFAPRDTGCAWCSSLLMIRRTVLGRDSRLTSIDHARVEPPKPGASKRLAALRQFYPTRNLGCIISASLMRTTEGSHV